MQLDTRIDKPGLVFAHLDADHSGPVDDADDSRMPLNIVGS